MESTDKTIRGRSRRGKTAEIIKVFIYLSLHAIVSRTQTRSKQKIIAVGVYSSQKYTDLSKKVKRKPDLWIR